MELLGQILIKRNIRYWLNTSLFNFDTHKGLTVKIYIILVCTQQQWALGNDCYVLFSKKTKFDETKTQFQIALESFANSLLLRVLNTRGVPLWVLIYLHLALNLWYPGPSIQCCVDAVVCAVEGNILFYFLFYLFATQ